MHEIHSALPIAGSTRRIGWAAKSRIDWHLHYFYFLLLVLAGYAVLGKGFAYVGYPPLLIGEIAMMLGMVVIFRSRCLMAMLATLPALLIAVLLAMTFVRVAYGLTQHGIDAVRDGVVIIYALYAFIVMALLLEDPRRLRLLLKAFGVFAVFYTVIGGIVPQISELIPESVPKWPHLGVAMLDVRMGEAAVHLAGIAIFVLLGMRKFSMLWIALLALAILALAPSRAALLCSAIAIFAAATLGNKLATFIPPLLVGAGLFVLAYAANLNIDLPDGRIIGPQQIIDNIESIVGQSKAANLDGTKEWRLKWWKAIVDYTVNGPYFWTGKGFGLGLAETDGFVVGLENGGPVVRSPHSVHMTILARTGIPGLLLWLVTLVVWFGAMLHTILVAKSRRETQWASILIWVACYAGAIVINASFDVAIEGPMQGILFWSLLGLGCAVMMIYRYEIAMRPGEIIKGPLESKQPL